MLEDIKNQHYVWRHYLKPWLCDDRIWCHSEHKIQFRKIRKIVKDIYFYKVEKLTENEKLFIKEYIRRGDESSYPLLESIIAICENAANGNDVQQKNTIENYHSFSERLAIPLLDKLYNNDLSFWTDDSERAIFSGFIGLQYTRTKKDRNAVTIAFKELLNHPGNPGDIDPQKISGVLALIDAERIGNWIFSTSEPTIIDMESEDILLTNDQPVYNLHANEKKEDLTPVEKFELFYPLTPSKALVIGKGRHIYKSTDFYNKFIINAASDFVFSKTEACLTKYFG